MPIVYTPKLVVTAPLQREMKPPDVRENAGNVDNS